MLHGSRYAISHYDPACTWIDAPDALLAAETAKQGARYADTLLVAPLRCRTPQWFEASSGPSTLGTK